MKLKRKKKRTLEIIEEQANKEMHLLQEVGVRSPDFNNKKLTKPIHLYNFAGTRGQG